MIKHSPHNDDAPPGTPLFGNPLFGNPGGGSLNPMSAAFRQAGEVYTKACADWQQEVTRFTAARLEEARALQQALASCRTMNDVGKFQQDWAMTVARAYITEATRLANIFAKLTQPKA